MYHLPVRVYSFFTLLLAFPRLVLFCSLLLLFCGSWSSFVQAQTNVIKNIPSQNLTSQKTAPTQKFPLFSAMQWRELEKGLTLGVSHVQNSKQSLGDALTIIKISPDHFVFSLHMASLDGTARNLAEWGQQHNLIAGINASMYLQDNKTSTGYMRSNDHTNNNHIGSKLGAFFVANPLKDHLPEVNILEAESSQLLPTLRDYSLVVQNYRLTNSQQEILWQKGGDLNSIAAIAKDTQGDIFFILCQEPLSVTNFTTMLQKLNGDITIIMYVEGGNHAGLFFTTMASSPSDTNPKKTSNQQLSPVTLSNSTEKILNFTPNPEAKHPFHILTGKKRFSLVPANAQLSLPNILGISRKTD